MDMICKFFKEWPSSGIIIEIELGIENVLEFSAHPHANTGKNCSLKPVLENGFTYFCCVYVHMYTCVYLYMCMHVRVGLGMCVHMNICVHGHVCISVYLYMCAYMCVFVYVCAYIFICVYVSLCVYEVHVLLP